MLHKKVNMFFAFYFSATNIFFVPLFAIEKSSSQILIRDHKTYRIYYQNQASILVNKKSIKNIMVYKKNNSVMTTRSDENIKIVEYMVPAKQKRHVVVYKFENNSNPQIGYYANNRQIYFAAEKIESANEKRIDNICEKTKNRNFLDVKKVAIAINESVAFDNKDIKDDLLDENTCNEDDSSVVAIKETLSQLFNQNGKKIIECLQSDTAQKKLEKDQALLMQANIFVSRIVGFLDEKKLIKINTNLVSDKFKNNFKIKCESTPKMEGKVACFDDSYENPSMSIDLEKIPKVDGKIDIEKLNSYILHEFMHVGTQQPETSGADPKCLDEAIVQSLQGLCGDQNEAKKCPEPLIVRATKDKECTLACAAAVTSANEVAQSSPIKTENQIPTVTEVSQLANATLPQMTSPTVARNYKEGDKIQVTDPTTISQVSNAFAKLNILSSNAGTVMKAAAAAAVGNVAVANAPIASRSAPNAASDPQSTYVPYPPAEIMADKYSPGSDDGTVSRLANSTLNTNGSTPSEKSASGKINTTAIIATSKNESLPNQAAAQDSVEPTTQIDSAQGSRKIASVTTSAQKTQATSFAESPTRSQLVENLKIRKIMTGNDYKEIRKYYADPSFKTQLSGFGISIELKTESTNQKLRAIGADSNSKIKFIDDGKNLIRQK